MGYQASKAQYALVVVKVSLFSLLLAIFFVAPFAYADTYPCFPSGTSSPIGTCTSTGSSGVSVTAIVLDPNAPPPVATSTPPITGGGGGFSQVPELTQVGGALVMSGRFAPNSTVSLLFSGNVVKKVDTENDGSFTITVSNMAPGLYSVMLTAEDIVNKKAFTSVNFTLYVNDSVQTVVTNITFPPLYLASDVPVQTGKPFSLSGKAIPLTEVDIFLDKKLYAWPYTATSGIFIAPISNNILEVGMHILQLRQHSSTSTFDMSKEYLLEVIAQDKEVITTKKKLACGTKADFSNDCRVNLIDFSILAYWHNRVHFPVKFDLNGDGKINLRDFSIMAYYWTG